jgi:hypothetical protein
VATCALLPFSLGLSQALPRRPIPPGGGRAAGLLGYDLEPVPRRGSARRPLWSAPLPSGGRHWRPWHRCACHRQTRHPQGSPPRNQDRQPRCVASRLSKSRPGILTTPAARRKAWTQEGFALALYQDDAKPRPSPTKWRGSHRIGLRGEQFSSHEAPAPQGLALLSPAPLGLLVRCSATTLTPRCLESCKQERLSHGQINTKSAEDGWPRHA